MKSVGSKSVSNLSKKRYRQPLPYTTGVPSPSPVQFRELQFSFSSAWTLFFLPLSSPFTLSPSSSSARKLLPLLLYQWASAHRPEHFGFLLLFYLRYINFHMKMKLWWILQQLLLMCVNRFQFFQVYWFSSCVVMRKHLLCEDLGAFLSIFYSQQTRFSTNFFTGDSHVIPSVSDCGFRKTLNISNL